jgi:hypothetical protein
MIRIIAALATLLALAAPAWAVDRRFSVTDFDRVIVEGPYRVHLVTGRPSSAVARGTRQAIDGVSVDVQGQTLRIRRNRNAWGGSRNADPGPLDIELATRNLRSVRLVGPTRVEVQGGSGLNVDFSVEGSGALKVTGVAADNLSLGLLGSGRIEIAGTVGRLRADFQGTGDVAGRDLIVTQEAVIGTTTAGTVALTVNGPATVNANGLGDVAIFGRPTCTLRGMGEAQVRCPASDQR